MDRCCFPLNALPNNSCKLKAPQRILTTPPSQKCVNTGCSTKYNEILWQITKNITRVKLTCVEAFCNSCSIYQIPPANFASDVAVQSFELHSPFHCRHFCTKNKIQFDKIHGNLSRRNIKCPELNNIQFNAPCKVRLLSARMYKQTCK